MHFCPFGRAHLMLLWKTYIVRCNICKVSRFCERVHINASQRRTLLAGFSMISRRNTSFNVQAAQLSNNLGSAMYNKIRRSVRMDCLIQTVLLPTRIHTSMKEYT